MRTSGHARTGVRDDDGDRAHGRGDVHRGGGLRRGGGHWNDGDLRRDGGRQSGDDLRRGGLHYDDLHYDGGLRHDVRRRAILRRLSAA